ncbi:hypothetical protein BKI52_42600 [marine bacterium AO1-C]|nr:hypothetical protein BKI52_42600 [marine bacterium AO1-C]
MKLDLITFFASLGVIQGIFLWLVIWKKQQPTKPAKYLLLGLITIHSYVLFMYVLMQTSLHKVVPHFIGTHIPFALLIAPCLWFYLQFLAQAKIQFLRYDFLHLLPALLQFIILIPLYGLSGEEKINACFCEFYPLRLELVEMVKLLISFSYGWLSFRLIRKQLKLNLNKSQTKIFKWVLLFVVLYLLDSIGSWVFHLTYYLKIQTSSLAYGLSIVGVLLLTFVLYGFAYLAIIYPDFLSNKVEHSASNSPKYHSSSLKDSTKEHYKDTLIAYLESEKPYINNTLKLEDVARVLNIPTPHLSEIINQDLGKNFSELVNGYRVEAVKSKISDPNESHKTLLSLAFEVGFNSKSAFNRFFKEYTGMTPSQYRKTIVANKT